MTSATPSSYSVLSQLASGGKYDRQDSFIAVMGVTGSGKSTFISRVVVGGAKVGHDLVSCTSEIESFTFQYNGNTVHLIDTPGFDDTYRTDSDVLKDIAFWLNTAYRQDIRLSGIVYLHPIDKNRVTGLLSVVLATTMWRNVEEVDGERHLEQLKSRADFWGNMIAQGSRVFRHEDNRASAMNIVSFILDQQARTVLQIQRQMVDEGKSLDETSAGQELEKELLKQRDLFERRLREAQEEMQEAVAEGNRRAIDDAAEQQERFQRKLDEALKGSSELKVTMEKLLEQKDAEYQQAVEELQLERQRSVHESKQTAQVMEDLRLKMEARDEEADEYRRKHRIEIEEMNLRFSKQQLESQASLQEFIAEQSRLSALSDTASVYTTTNNRPMFEEPPRKNADESFGQAVGAVGGVVGLVAAAASCNVM